MDELLQELRRLGVGCHIGGMFMGATIYADDVILIAPCRSALQLMLKVCEDFALRNNLRYSSDPNPVKSKSKCIFMSGKSSTDSYPAPLVLNGQTLPWVKTAAHLGHQLSQECDMESDAKAKRMDFIEKSTDIREGFSFAHPVQVLTAVTTYTAHFYGAMVWNLYGEEAGKVFRTWDTAVKLAWGVPRSTHTYLVPHLLSSGLPSTRKRLLCQYLTFFKKLRHSTCKEVRVLSEIVARDAKSPTGHNFKQMERV